MYSCSKKGLKTQGQRWLILKWVIARSGLISDWLIANGIHPLIAKNRWIACLSHPCAVALGSVGTPTLPLWNPIDSYSQNISGRTKFGQWEGLWSGYTPRFGSSWSSQFSRPWTERNGLDCPTLSPLVGGTRRMWQNVKISWRRVFVWFPLNLSNLLIIIDYCYWLLLT